MIKKRTNKFIYGIDCSYMAWRDMLSTQKIQKNSSITVDHTLWDDPACKNSKHPYHTEWWSKLSATISNKLYFMTTSDDSNY